MKKLIIFGIKSTAKEIYEYVCYSNKYHFDEIQMIHYNENSLKALKEMNEELYYIISFSNISLRDECIEAISQYKFLKPFSIIHENAYVSPSAKIGSGVYIAPNSTISTDVTIDDHVIINLNASIGHDAQIKCNVIILTGARVSGNCRISTGTLIGSNAFILNGVLVEEYNQIDALCYISKDLKPKMISSVRHATKTIRQIK